MNDPKLENEAPRRRSKSGYVVIGILLVMFILMASEVIPRDWMPTVLLLMVLLVLIRLTVRLILERQERLRRQSRKTSP